MNCKLRPSAAANYGWSTITINRITFVDCAGSQIGHVLTGEEDARQVHPLIRFEKPVEGEDFGWDGKAACMGGAGVEAGGDLDAPVVIEFVIELIAPFDSRPGRCHG